jgi:tellurite resistance protein TerC
MLGIAEITAWHWAGFLVLVLLLLSFDLGVFHRKAHVVSFGEACLWTGVWMVLAALFAAGIYWFRDTTEAVEFVTGYLIELSLSMDNVFVIALVFAYFRVPLALQHRVLFWGILGALVMRGVMIGLGAVLVQHFHWLLYGFGGFLIITGIRQLSGETEAPDPEKSWIVRAARRLFPISPDFDGQRFVTRVNDRFALTPLTIVLLMVETTDLIFAVDSIPAIFGVTEKPFIIFTSNVFAILGLRSLYFVLANAIGYFRFLKFGLSLVLIFIGVKMFLPLFKLKIPTLVSLLVVAGIIILSIGASVVSTWRNQKRP